MNLQPTISLYPASNYSFGTKPAKKSDEVEVSVSDIHSSILLLFDHLLILNFHVGGRNERFRKDSTG